MVQFFLWGIIHAFRKKRIYTKFHLLVILLPFLAKHISQSRLLRISFLFRSLDKRNFKTDPERFPVLVEDQRECRTRYTVRAFSGASREIMVKVAGSKQKVRDFSIWGEEDLVLEESNFKNDWPRVSLGYYRVTSFLCEFVISADFYGKSCFSEVQLERSKLERKFFLVPSIIRNAVPRISYLRACSERFCFFQISLKCVKIHHLKLDAVSIQSSC